MKKAAIFQLIDTAHQEDPNKETWQNEVYPAEYLYGLRCSDWLKKLAPNATELQEIAARAQHFRRWEIPRSNYPMDKKGYHQWRIELYKYQADHVVALMKQVGYDQDSCNEVWKMIAKKDLRNDPNTQLIEDVACLVFLNYYITPFAGTKDYSEEKWIKIIQKTWNKMSEPAHQLAFGIDYEEGILGLIRQALS